MPKNLLLLFALPFAAPLPAQTPYTNPAVEQREDYIAGNPCQRDLLLFVDLLRTSHPAFCTGEEAPFSADSISEAGYRLAARCRSAAELQPLLQRIAARLHDGHTQVYPHSQARSHYPLELFGDGRELRLQAVAPEWESALGKRIDSLNDRPVQEVLESLRTMLSYDNEAGFRLLANMLLQAPALWQQSPCARADSALRIVFSDGERIELTPRPGKVRNLASVRKAPADYPVRPTRDPFAYTLLPGRNVCYLQFNRCQDQSTARVMHRYTGTEITDEMEAQLQRMPRFDHFAEELFRRIEAEGIRTLVIDLSRNSGGNSRLCDVLLSWLRPLDSLRTFSSAIRLSPLWERQYPRMAQRLRERFERSGQTLDPDRLYDQRDSLFRSDGRDEATQELFLTNRDPQRCFRGRVIVVQGPGTFSSAGILATMIADNGIGEIVGRQAAFRPSHYGDLLMWELPHTGLRGSVSSKFFARPDASRNGECMLRPDVELAPTWEEYLRGIDPVQQWILDRTAPEAR